MAALRHSGIQTRFYTQLLVFLILVAAHTVFVGFAVEMRHGESENGRAQPRRCVGSVL
jgi:hypothetical protein